MNPVVLGDGSNCLAVVNRQLLTPVAAGLMPHLVCIALLGHCLSVLQYGVIRNQTSSRATFDDGRYLPVFDEQSQ